MVEPIRCAWAQKNALLQTYHDREWGVPLYDSRRLFELLLLEGAQAGLAWDTILAKRAGYRRAFDRFDPQKMSRYGAAKVKALVAELGLGGRVAFLGARPPRAMAEEYRRASVFVLPSGQETSPLAIGEAMASGVAVVATRVDGLDDQGLRDMADRIRERIGSGVVVLGAVRDDGVLLLAAVTKDLTKRFHAGNIIKRLAPMVGGGGGGRPDFAQAGGKDASRLDAALAAAYDLVGAAGQ